MQFSSQAAGESHVTGYLIVDSDRRTLLRFSDGRKELSRDWGLWNCKLKLFCVFVAV